MHHQMWGDSKGWLCPSLPFFPVLYISPACPATHSSLLGWLGQGWAFQEGPAWLPCPHAAFGLSSWMIFHSLLKKQKNKHKNQTTVSPPNESHNHSCDAAAGRECTASQEMTAMPGHRGNRRGLAGGQVQYPGPLHVRELCLALWAPTVLLMDRSAVRLRAVRLTPRCLTLVPPRAPTGKTCRYGKTDLCEGMSVLHEGQWEIRLTGLSSIHSRCISYRLLLFRIYFAISNTCPNQELPHWPKVFGVFPFLDSLVGPRFLKENNLFAQKKWNNTHNLSVLWWWQKLHSPLSLTDNLRGFG